VLGTEAIAGWGLELELELVLGLLPAPSGAVFFFGADCVLLFLCFGAMVFSKL
jgi:hypothetical protein